MGGLWSLLTIVGPILLLLALLYALLQNRKHRGNIDQTERATHDLQDSLDHEDKLRDDHRIQP